MIKAIIQRLTCKHPAYFFVCNIYGDAINFYHARSVWDCPLCEKQILHYRLVRGTRE